MFKIWRIDGTLLNQTPMDELYQIEWQQLPSKLFPNRPPKRGDSAPAKLEKKQEESAKPAVYRPRHLAGRTAPSLALGRPKEPQNKAQVVLTSSQLEAERQRKKAPIGGIVKSKAQLKNERRRKKKEEEAAAGGSGPAAVPAAKKKAEKAAEVPAPAAAATADPVTVAQKKVKALEKKLRQLDAIQTKIDAGGAVNDAQKAKLAGRPAVLADVEKAKAALQALQG
jgi:partner of Y14 and mago protein